MPTLIREPTRDEAKDFRHLFEDFYGADKISDYSEEAFADFIVDPDATVRVKEGFLCRLTFSALLAERPPLPFAEGDMLTEVAHLLPEGPSVGLFKELLVETFVASATKHPDSRERPIFAVLTPGRDPVGVLVSNGVEKARAWKQIMGFRELEVLSGPRGNVGFIYAPHLGRFLEFLGR